MTTAALSRRPRKGKEPDGLTSTINKTCVPCRARKIKCDAPILGLPCSNCTSRQSAEDCALPGRKKRTVPKRAAPKQTKILPASSAEQSISAPASSTQSPAENGSDLLYLNILNSAVKDKSGQHTPAVHLPIHGHPVASGLALRSCTQHKSDHLDDVDNEYLVKKGIFDLPPRHYVDAFLKTYFHYVYPFTSVINRVEFVLDYQSGNCSLFLLYTLLASACLNAPSDVLSGSGFTDHAAAQRSFFTKAKILYDFDSANTNPLILLQGSVILCMVILDRPTDRDFGYWLHNAVRLATKIDLCNKCLLVNGVSGPIRLYRRIWWTLHSLDIFQVLSSLRWSRLLADNPMIQPRCEDDCDADNDDVLQSQSLGLLSTITPKEKALPVVYCELSRIFATCLSTAVNSPDEAEQLLDRLDEWRRRLPTTLHVSESRTGLDTRYLTVLTISYRYECMLCRRMEHRNVDQRQYTAWAGWAGQRLRSAILELDTIVLRVLGGGTLQDFPVPFITTMTALLALHIESALDQSQTELVRDRARISIGQTMLLLNQGKKVPVLKRALPVFEEILEKRGLASFSASSRGSNTATPLASRRVREIDCVDSTAYGATQPDAQASGTSFQSYQQWETVDPLMFDMDFLGFDFMDDWQSGQFNVSY